jgi:ACT domain-containing protein
MVMLVETDKLDINFGEFSELLSEQGKTMGLDIRVMHEDIFNSMHRI